MALSEARPAVAVVGSSGHARVVIDILERQGCYLIAGLIDRFRAPGETTLGYPVLGGEQALPGLCATQRLAGVVVAIGDNSVRAAVAEAVAGLCPGLPLVGAVHPAATLGRDVSLGPGAVVMAGAVIGPCCRIGRLCIVNTRACLDHDSVLGDHASLAPGVVTGGGCRVGEYSAVGIGAVLSHGVSVGAHAVVGAGSTVLRPVPDAVVAYGSPARVVRTRRPGEPYL